MTTPQEHALCIELPALQYKGQRTYLHGTDILMSSLQTISEHYRTTKIENLDIVFHRLVASSLVLVSPPPQATSAHVKLACTIDDIPRKFALIENGHSVTGRYEYDEEQIVATTEVASDNRTAFSSASLPYNNIERWVAMTKHLHQQGCSHIQGKWLFARGLFFDSNILSEKLDGTHEIRVESIFNDRFTRSSVRINNKKIGEIFFSLE